ncbi:hypothetical protein AACH06_17870 [Ideonella sp. DXS29W]|uniref:Uncharacterized protein n=1 Tax=Ideonella lacteola TaxID=2984193 RepID=A0ABU9BS57_9BURK
MKIRLIATAALMAAAGSSHALSLAAIDSARSAGTLKEVVIFGASAQTPMLAAYLKNVVCAGAADYDEFWNDASGKNFRAYSCTMSIASGYPKGSKLLVIKRDKDGSIYGVNQVANNTAGQSMVVSSAACSAYNHAVTPAATCGTTAPQTPIAGISDVEPALFSKAFKIGNAANQYLNQPDPASTDDAGNAWAVPTTAALNGLDIASAGQTIFGVAVSKTLRNALQSAQGLTVNSDADADMPSLSRAFIAGALSGFVRGGPVATYANWSAVTGVAADAAKNVVVCRRTRGSGTQAVSNAFFLEMGPMADTAVGMLSPVASGAAANTDGTPVPGLVVNEGSGTGDVETCLGTTHTNDFALGVVSREKDPLVNGKSYRFVKIDGSAPKQALARTGAYPFVYTSSMQWRKTTNAPDAQTKSFLIGIRANAVTSNKISLYASSEAKGGLLASPHKWQVATDTCGTATDADDAIYGSCVERIDVGNTTHNPGSHVYGVANFKTTSSAPLHIVK